MFSLRPATKEDFPEIRALIHAVGINPMGLDWRHFIVAIAENGEFIGCGQIKNHRDGSRELASIAVVQRRRGQGVATRIIKRLLDGVKRPIYLTCRGGLGPFYEKFGFHTIQPDEMTPYFRRVSRLANALVTVLRMQEGLLVMKLEAGQSRD
jgi:N-acetylglutamate synthase-like GNAT family acetyltransferase